MANNDLTVLLTLWDRVPCTLRWLAYANQIDFPFKVLIADGGRDESVPKTLAGHSNFPNVNYDYIRYPYDATPGDYYAKVLDALNRVETPFVVLADNDDFFVVDGLLKSVEFLQAHPDYSSCRGIIGGFKIETSGDAMGDWTNIYGPDVSFVRQIYPDGPTVEETAVERMHNYFSNYRATWYDISRIEQIRKNFRTLRDLNTQDLILSQHIPMLLGLIAGKVHVGSYLYLFRQLEGVSSTDRTETKEKADLFERMLLPTWSSDFKGFLDVISNALCEKDGITVDEARRETKRAYRTFIGPHLVYDLQPEVRLPRAFRAARRVLSYLGPLRTPLRKLYPSLERAVIGSPGQRQFIPAARLLQEDPAYKLIYDFLATTPPAQNAAHVGS